MVFIAVAIVVVKPAKQSGAVEQERVVPTPKAGSTRRNSTLFRGDNLRQRYGRRNRRRL